jgi:hypothetical protein
LKPGNQTFNQLCLTLLEQQEEWQLEGRRVVFEPSMAKLDSSNDPGQDQLTAVLAAAA